MVFAVAWFHHCFHEIFVVSNHHVCHFLISPSLSSGAVAVAFVPVTVALDGNGSCGGGGRCGPTMTFGFRRLVFFSSPCLCRSSDSVLIVVVVLVGAGGRCGPTIRLMFLLGCFLSSLFAFAGAFTSVSSSLSLFLSSSSMSFKFGFVVASISLVICAVVEVVIFVLGVI